MASVKNAAARFNVTPEYVRKLCRTGKICYTAISSRKWLVNMDTLAQFFAQGEPVREDSQQVTNGLVLDSDMLLDDLIDRWFEEYANKQLKAKTLYDYRRMRGRISAGLGHLKVSKIKPAHVMAFYDNLEEKGVRRDSTYTATKALLNLLPHGTRGELAKKAGIGQDTMRMVYAGKSVSRKTAEKVSAAVGLAFSKAFAEHTKKDGKLNNNSVIRYQAMLSSIFKKGVQWGLINENPCSRAEHPKAEEIDIRVLTEEEIPTLLDALSDAPPQYSVITQLALLLGARRGEICALRWSDIDFEKGTLSIKRTVQSIPGIGLVLNTPKTRRGKRCLRIGADCVELLQEYRRYQKAERFRIGSAWVRKVTLENGKVVDNDMLFSEVEWRADGPGYYLVLVPEVSGSTQSSGRELSQPPPFECKHPDCGTCTDHNGLRAAWTCTDIDNAELLCIGPPTRHTSSPQGRGRPCNRQACPWWSGYEQPCGAFRFHCKRPHTPALVGMQGVFMI